MRFRYRAIDKDGRISKGIVEAADRAAVAAHLHSQGLRPISAAPDRRLSAIANALSPSGDGRVRLTQKQVSEITRQLAVMLRTEITLTDALAILKSENEVEPAKRLLDELQNTVTSGGSFSSALGKYPALFDRFYVSIVRAGEMGGELGKAMMRLAIHRENAAKLRAEILAAVTYPAVLTVISFLSLFIIAVFVMPKFSEMLRGSDAALPLLTAIILNICNVVAAYWELIVLLLLTTAFWIKSLLHKPAPRAKAFAVLFRVPAIARLMTSIEFARFTRSLAHLVDCGIPLVDGMQVSGESIANPLIRQGIVNVTERVRTGASLSVALGALPNLPGFAVPIIASGEAGGAMGEVLVMLSDAIDDDSRALLNRLMSIIEPVLIVGIGMIIGLMITSVLSAIMSLNEIGI